jgi:sugar lactone lactonase YvrE
MRQGQDLEGLCGRLEGYGPVFLCAVMLVVMALMAPARLIAAPPPPLLVTDSNNNRVLLFNPPFHTAQVAALVLGQPDFKSAVSGATQNLTGGQPVNAIMDKNRAIWVTDQNNNRVLRFSPPFRNGKQADLVLGQTDFSRSDAGSPPSASNLWSPTYMTFDSSGNLWVSDRNNCRVIEYQTPFSTGMSASVVLGEADLLSGTCAASASRMSQTEGLVFDQAGDLWVVDRGNNRVLEFVPPFSNGMAAGLVIGQANFSSVGFQAGQAGLNHPNGLAFLNGNLWVADTFNNRTLEFEPPFTSSMGASVVLGQPDFTTTNCNTTRNGECGAFAVAGDPKGNLWLADLANCRVLQYKPDSRGLFATNQNARIVIGEANFTTAFCSTKRARTNSPQGVSIGGSP